MTNSFFTTTIQTIPLELSTMKTKILPWLACVLSVLLLDSISLQELHGESKIELLWPKGAPFANGDEEKDRPKLIMHLPNKQLATGTAVIICPGGGYAALALDYEGREIAQWFNSFGVAGFICDYRHRGKGYGHPAPLLDAQQAIRTVRSRAKEFHLDPHRIGIAGFSAGGHLASTTATHFETDPLNTGSPTNAVSCRPDFTVLGYPVIAFNEPFTHLGSQHNLLGKNADMELVKSLSNEKQVSPQTPPTFLWHTTEDTGVLPDNSIVFYLALLRAGVPAELHIYEKGHHGLGLAKSVPGTSNWPSHCQQWMRARGLLEKRQ